jgi:hypothetical protein
MAFGLAIIAILIFVGWLIYRSIRQRTVKAHFVSYGIAIIAAVFTYAYFLSLDYPKLIKILGSIVLGVILIIVAALYQRHRTSNS